MIKSLPVNARFWLSLARRRGCSALINAGQMACSCAGINTERITPVFRVKHTKQIRVLTPVQGIQGHRSLRFFCLLHVFVSLFFPSSLLSSFFSPNLRTNQHHHLAFSCLQQGESYLQCWGICQELHSARHLFLPHFRKQLAGGACE